MSDLLPYNATPQERALSESVARVGAVPVPIREVWSADDCPADKLAWLAGAFSVDEWQPSWTEAQKREFIKRSVDVHRHKGTIGAVVDALGALGIEARVQEWFNQVPAGEPYTFRILLDANQIGIGEATMIALFGVVERTKNLRSHLERVSLSVRSVGGPSALATAGMGNEITMPAYLPPVVVSNETALVF